MEIIKCLSMVNMDIFVQILFFLGIFCHFYNQKKKINIKEFGSIHIKFRGFLKILVYKIGFRKI